MAKPEHEQNEADPVAKEPDRHGEAKHPEGWNGLLYEPRQAEINGARDDAFEARDQHRVARGHLPSQIVVDSPAEAG